MSAPSRRRSSLTCPLAGGLLALALLASASAAQEDAPGFRPLLLDGQTSLDVEATPGLDLGPRSTIEFVVATAWEDGDGVTAWPAVLGRREPYAGDEPAGFAAATQYSVHFAPDRRSIGLFDGTRYASVPFDFTDGDLHHVALVTSEGETTVYVDREVRGTLPLGLGTTPGLPLHVGSSDGGSELFVGVVPSVRLWRAALTAEEVKAVADVLGVPDDPAVDVGDLAAVTDFDAGAPQLVVLEERSAEAAALPNLPSRKPGSGVESRGLRKKQKVAELQESIAETEGSQRARKIEVQRIDRRLQKFTDVAVTEKTVRIGPKQFRRPRKIANDGDVLTVAEEQRLVKRWGKLQRKIDDYAKKLDAGTADYSDGSVQRAGLRLQLAKLQGPEAEADLLLDAQAGAARDLPRGPRRRLPYVEPPVPGSDVQLSDGPYRVVRQFGEGGFGGIYLVEQRGPGEPPRRAVLKHQEPKPSTVENPQQRTDAKRARFGRAPRTPREDIEAATSHEVEMQNLAASGNPHVGPAELVAANRMRLRFEGAAMDGLMNDPEWTRRDADQKLAALDVMIRKTLEAAATLHRKGIVHRDLHLGNLMVDPASAELKIIDFGLAKRVRDSDLELELDRGVGLDGVRGAAAPPEARRARDADDLDYRGGPGHDVYTLGIQFKRLRDDGGGLAPFESEMKVLPSGERGATGRTLPRTDPRLARLDEFLDLLEAPLERRPATAAEALRRFEELDLGTTPEQRDEAWQFVAGRAQASVQQTIARVGNAAAQPVPEAEPAAPVANPALPARPARPQRKFSVEEGQEQPASP